MEVTYRAYLDEERVKILGQSGNPSEMWNRIRTSTNALGASKDELKAGGWRVKRHIDVEDSDLQVAGEIAMEIVPVKKLGFFGKILKAIIK